MLILILLVIYSVYSIRVRNIVEYGQKLEAEVEKRTEDLNKSNKELEDFAYIVSHDLKAPLRGINELSEWISEDYSDKLDKEGKEDLNMLRERTSKMNDMIQGILEYSRIGRTELEEEKIDLNNLVEGVIALLAPPDNIKITIEDKLPEYTANGTRLGELFQNLISNAVKYIDKPEGIIKISCTEEENQWKFSVSDNGPGIDEKYFEKIFKIFQTLGTEPTGESTGIGLTIVKKIIDLYEGKIWVESAIEKGTTFYFTLPKQEVSLR
jgi:light-regulated signal transduction histidine kinase (bacteriophytochrome)